MQHKKIGKKTTQLTIDQYVCSNISKVYETIINYQIISFCADNIIPVCQFGFQYKYSTIHAINRLTFDINWALNGKKCLGACLIDLEKAFDTVWLEGFIFKIINHKFPKHLIQLIYSMIKGRAMIAASRETYSKQTFKINDGLQQETVNSSILFNIYTSDMLKLYDFNKPGSMQAIAFADDLIVYVRESSLSKIKSELQNTLHKLENHYETWKLTINLNKCETILFRLALEQVSKKVRKNYKAFRVNSQANNNVIHDIPHRNIVKYLGIYLDERLHYKQHVEKQLEKAS